MVLIWACPNVAGADRSLSMKDNKPLRSKIHKEITKWWIVAWDDSTKQQEFLFHIVGCTTIEGR